MAEARTWRDEEQRGPNVPDLDGPETPRRLSASARADRVGREGDPWLFHRKGRPIKSFRRAWRTACKNAEVPGRIPHDFRRTAIRNLERAGIPRSAAMAMVGHKTESVYRRYAIVEEGMLNEAGVKLQTFYDNAKAGPSSVVRFPRARARRGAKA